MKVKNIAFSGFMAAVLIGAVATPADAVSVASKEYVDARETAINTNLTTNYLTKTDAGDTYVTQQAAEAFQDADDVTTAITSAVTDNAALSGALADKEDKANKVNEITEENKGSTDYYPSVSAISKYVTDLTTGEIDNLGALARESTVTDALVADNANIAQSKIAGLTDLATQVGTNTTAITTLNGDAGTDGSVANTIAKALADGGQIDALLDGKQDKLSQDQIDAIAQVATNTANIAQNAENIAANTDAIAGKVSATGQTANQIMVTDASGNVTTAATISASQVDALNKLATAELPDVCTNNEGTLCALTVDKQGDYAWTVITEPTTQNP